MAAFCLMIHERVSIKIYENCVLDIALENKKKHLPPGLIPVSESMIHKMKWFSSEMTREWHVQASESPLLELIFYLD